MIKKFGIVLVSLLLISISGNANAELNYNGVDRGQFLGIDANIAAMFNNRQKASEIKSKAYVAEVKRRPESILDMSCFSDSMTNFASIGNIFSDVKFDFNFNFSGNPLCSLMELGMDADVSLEKDLQLFFKVPSPAINLPSFQICSPSLDVSGMISDKISGMLGGSLNYQGLDQGLNLFGCSIDIGLDIGGSLQLQPMCAQLELPSFECGALGQLVQSEVTNAIAGAVGADLNKGFNNGWTYMSFNEQGELDVGADISLQDILNDTGIGGDVTEAINKAQDFVNNLGGFAGGFSLEAGISFEGGVSTNGSGDGLSSDGSFGVEAGHKSSFGTGEEFSYQLTSEKNAAIQQEIKNDAVAIQEGPGGQVGTWKPIPTINKTVTLQEIIDAIKDDANNSQSN